VQPSIPGWQQPAQPPPVMNPYNQQGALPHTWQMSGPMPSVSQPPMANPSMLTGQQQGANNMSPRVSTTESPAWAAFASTNKTAWGANAGASGGNNPGGNQTAETKKKGFFDSIRDFFFK
jgi:hypothetical protein